MFRYYSYSVCFNIVFGYGYSVHGRFSGRLRCLVSWISTGRFWVDTHGWTEDNARFYLGSNTLSADRKYYKWGQQFEYNRKP